MTAPCHSPQVRARPINETRGCLLILLDSADRVRAPACPLEHDSIRDLAGRAEIGIRLFDQRVHGVHSDSEGVLAAASQPRLQFTI